MKAYIVNLNDLKEIALTNKNVEDNILSVVVSRVQLTVVKPLLGTSQFNRIIQGVVDNDLTAEEVDFIDNHLAYLIGAAMDRKAINAVTSEIRSKTAGKASDEHITALSNADNLMLDNSIKWDIEALKQDCIEFLLENIDSFPLFAEFYGCNKPKKGYDVNVSFI